MTDRASDGDPDGGNGGSGSTGPHGGSDVVDHEFDLDELRAFARELSYCTDEDVLEACLAKVEDMADRIDLEPPAWESGENRGRPSEDEYNALLYVYETPRKEAGSGPLDGMSLAIKDHIAVEGLPMTAGLAEHSFVPRYDAVLVERLLAAGAAITGKANMDALAVGPEGVWSERGQVHNPIAEDRVPGGSSSGSAVAVATGLADAAIGSDAGGSIRKPAAYNGLVGVKPSQGVVPAHGKVHTQTTLGAVGPIAKNVSDGARVLDVIAGPDRRDPGAAAVDLGLLAEGLEEPLSCTIGVPEPFFEVADPPVRNVVEALVDDVADRTDCEVRSVSVDNSVSRLPSFVSHPEFAALLRARAVNYGGGVASDAGWHALVEAIHEEGLNEHLTLRKLPGAFLAEQTDGLSYVAAQKKLTAFQQSLDATFEEVDLLLTPTVPALAPKLDEDIENLPRNLSINCQPFNVAGTPSVAVPAGRAEGLPVSAQVTAPLYEDGLALRGARMVERVRE